MIAAALDDNSLYFWDAQMLIDKSGDALIEQGASHTTAIKAIAFSPYHPEILATVGGEGQSYIYSVNDISNPSRLDNAQSLKDDLESLAWNRKSENILATGSSTGAIMLWDISKKKGEKKELFKIQRKINKPQAITAIAWDPEHATKLVAANADDGDILLWELKSRDLPEKTLKGHSQAVLSLSWCQQDRNLLLSGGKDDKTMCWNPQTGEELGELPDLGAGRGIFQTRFNPHFPALLATASFDGKIAVHTLQNTNQPADQGVANGAADGDDFFSMAAQSQLEGASFNLKQAPKWLQRPVGASFGFGGKLVIFRSSKSSVASARASSVIQISQFSADADIAKAMEEFEASLKSQDIATICKSRIENATSDNERADYEAIEALAAPNPRTGVTEHLGFAKEATTSQQPLENDEQLPASLETEKEDEDIFAKLSSNDGPQSGEPFQLLSEYDPASDREISEAVAMGRFERGVDVCLREGRFLDAFLFAACGGEALVENVQKAYFNRKSSEGPSYLRVLAAVATKNLSDIVQNADLANWKSTMAIICSYADADEFPELCEALGDRILESGSRKDASFCYIVGSKLEKVINLWISELQDEERAAVQEDNGESTFSAHARILQNFVEKVTVFRKAAKFEDKEKDLAADWKLSPLYDRYVEYADILSSNGHLSTAAKYLELLPAKYPAAEVARSRVKQASSKATPAQARQQQANTQRTTQRAQPAPITFQPLQAPATNAGLNAYVPTAPAMQSNPYAPTSQAYTPQQGYMPPVAPQTNLGPQGYSTTRGMPQGNGYGQFGAPQPNTASLPLPPPPPKAKDMSNWNDTPMVTKPAISRRGTPGTIPAPITSPFPNQTGTGLPPSGPPFGGLVRGTPTPPPPPPKGSAVSRVSSPLNSGMPPSFQHPSRPASTSNVYSPSPLQSGQPFGHSVPPPTVARGPSPYNPPPAGAPPTSRYAPAPATQQLGQQLPGQIAPPPQSHIRPPPANNPYAPQQQVLTAQGHYGQNQAHPAQFSEPPRQLSAPPRATPPTSRPPTGQAQAPKPSAVVAPKYPPGDRSHIPESAQEMVNILSNEMQRVAAHAPTQYARRVNDTQKRLNILFDHLNNNDLLKLDTVTELTELARALQARNYDEAARMQGDIYKEKTAECGDWMVSDPSLDLQITELTMVTGRSEIPH